MSCKPSFVTIPIDLKPSHIISTNAVAEDLPSFIEGTPYTTGDRVIYNDAIYQATRSGSDLNAPGVIVDGIRDWVYVHTINPYRCIDDKIETQTEAQDVLTMEIQATGFVGSLALMNVYATTVRVQIVDSIDGVVYDSTKQMGFFGVNNLWAWLYEPFEQRTDISFSDLMTYNNPRVIIEVTAPPGEMAKLGHIVMGMPFEIGTLKANLSLGLTDYSRIQQDEFGNTSILRRSRSKYAKFLLMVDTSRVDAVRKTMDKIASRITFWHGLEDMESTLIVGFYKDMEIVVPNMQVSEMSLYIQGVI